MLYSCSSTFPVQASHPSLVDKSTLFFRLHLARPREQAPRQCTKALAALSSSSSAQVQARISVAANTGRLDLSDCGLEEVPLEVFSLTGLVDLSLAGNNITHIQDDIQKLTNLRRLGLAGNWITELPSSIGKLKQLAGLWLQGNLLCSLPDEIGHLGKLTTFALAGNRLEEIPDSIGYLTNLQVLSISGNKLQQVPSDIGKLGALKVLALNGNCLHSLPLSLCTLSSLEDLWLQGNKIVSLPADLGGMRSLKQLSLADNDLSYLPNSVGELHSIECMWLYGNSITKLPDSTCLLKELHSLWLEGNPLYVEGLPESLLLAPNLKALGVNHHVVLPERFQGELHKALKVNKIVGTGRAPSLGGYFKLQQSTEYLSNHVQAEVVVVAFGSAPGVPNWGGLLKRTRTAMLAGNIKPAFDILYVVDSRRSWYTENKVGKQWQVSGNSCNQSGLLDDSSIDDPAYPSNATKEQIEVRLSSYYQEELKEALRNYKRVVMLGDSMGASAALMFSTLATSVIAFCPQVDLAASSIRPGRESTWLSLFKEELLDAVMASSAHIMVHCGSWVHDLYQAKLLPDNKVELVVHTFDDHRLAKELDKDGSLLTIVRLKLEEEIGLAQSLM